MSSVRSHSDDARSAISGDDLEAGDVVVFRSPWSLDGPIFAKVDGRTGDGARLVSPRLGGPTLARTGTIERVTPFVDVLGLDDSGDTHVRRSDDVVAYGDPGDLDTYDLRDAGRSVLEWLQHVEQKRGWVSLASAYRDALDGDRA